MNKEELKLKLVDIFSDAEIKHQIVIDNNTISLYEKIFWDDFFVLLKNNSKYKNCIIIEPYRITSSIWYTKDSHYYNYNNEQKRLWNTMFPIIGEWFDNLGIKCSIEHSVNNDQPFCYSFYVIKIDDLKEFSNYKTLVALK